ncbi:MAG: hypothetical protein PHU14_07385 [Methylovulum sp.]|nr:hypothetical protein [Methylovulum sp.]
MTPSNLLSADTFGYGHDPSTSCPEPMQVQSSAVSWDAIMAGAAAAAALSLILLMLGAGLGLSSVSPWSYNGVSASAFGVSTILWLAVTQLIASGMGGYLAGRLRTKWIAVHTDEVYFRDTAHGFLAWAIASLATAALLTTVIGSIVSGGAHIGASAMGDRASVHSEKGHHDSGVMGYFVDTLFRKDPNDPATAVPETIMPPIPPPKPNTVEFAAEVARIFKNAVLTGSLPPEDSRYVGQVVAQRTGLSQQSAEQRVNTVYGHLQARLHELETTAKTVADNTRKASVYASIWMFISLLIGAFVASFAAIFGGRQRDL